MKQPPRLVAGPAFPPAQHTYPTPATAPEGAAAALGHCLLWIQRAGLSAPALLFLELNRPLSFLAAHFCTALDPLLSPLFPGLQLESWTALLEQPGAWDEAIAALEQDAHKRKGGQP